MKKVMLMFALIIVFASSISAHNGIVGIFLDEAATVDHCCLKNAFQMVELYILHVKGDGEELGRAVQFKVEIIPSDLLITQPPEWNPAEYTQC